MSTWTMDPPDDRAWPAPLGNRILFGPGDAPLRMPPDLVTDRIIPVPTPACYFVRSHNTRTRLYWAARAFITMRTNLYAGAHGGAGNGAAREALSQLRHFLSGLVIGRRPPPETPQRTLAYHGAHTLALTARRMVSVPGLTINHVLQDDLRRETASLMDADAGAGSDGEPPGSRGDRADNLSASSFVVQTDAEDDFLGEGREPSPGPEVMQVPTEEVRAAVEALRQATADPGQQTLALQSFAGACLEWFETWLDRGSDPASPSC